MSPEIKEFIATFHDLLPLHKSITTSEAEKRASQFLGAMARITDWKHVLTENRIKCTSLERVVYAEELSNCTGKTVTENKTTVEASKPYVEARESMESVDNDISYLKTNYEIFQNAHVLYRNLAKGDFV